MIMWNEQIMWRLVLSHLKHLLRHYYKRVFKQVVSSSNWNTCPHVRRSSLMVFVCYPNLYNIAYMSGLLIINSGQTARLKTISWWKWVPQPSPAEHWSLTSVESVNRTAAVGDTYNYGELSRGHESALMGVREDRRGKGTKCLNMKMRMTPICLNNVDVNHL